METNYNIFAFPNSTVISPSDWGVQDGMTLLDYFAAKAMAELIPLCTVGSSYDKNLIVSRSYQIAEAMLEERKKYIK